uniref:Uncharacterized protein n=1 Tax=Geospiza parvula TaxID=87175 RepID=A0A8U8AUB4_GEOPR
CGQPATTHPLGWMLEHWEDSPRRMGKSKEKMIQFCMEKWGGKEVAKYVVWPMFGTFETPMCESLYDHEWEPLDNLPPPYLVPPSQPVPAQVPPLLALPPEASITQGQVSAPLLPPELAAAPSLPHGQAMVPPLPCKQRASTGDSDEEKEKPGIFPLQEVLMALGIIGFVHAPIDTGNVRAFKKEMGKLMDNPLGVAERLDEFLGTSTYAYEDLNVILRLLFNNEEREMIRQAAIKDWEHRNPQGGSRDQRWLNQKPSWNAQMEEGRQKMINLRDMVIQGIREAVPKGQNMSKVLRECQGKDETPTEWLERLPKEPKNLFRDGPRFSGWGGFVENSVCGKIVGRHMEKVRKDRWMAGQGTAGFAREAQSVYMRRDEEKQKIQAKVLVAAVREVQKQEQVRDSVKAVPVKKQNPSQGKGSNNQKKDFECYYCKQKGHIRRNCPNKVKDQAMFQED